jgi:RNA polymerase sigma factor for flagellar operon FliA
MLDEIRKQSVTKRLARERSRKLELARDRLRREGRESPGDHELAREARVEVAEVDRDRQEGPRRRFVSAREWGMASDTPDPSVLAQRRAASSRIANAISRLEARQQEIVRSRYFDETPMMEIAQNLGVSASRASQLFGEALAELRDELQDVNWPSTVPPAPYRFPSSPS